MRTHTFKIFVFLVLFSRATLCVGQNLVANGSFEEYTECPDFWNQIDRAVGWSRFRGSPDYFNACDENGNTDVSGNVVGRQDPASGEAYAGGYLWCDNTPSNLREYLGSVLTEPLVPGMPVYASFKVSPTTDGFLESMRWTVDGVGLRFSMEAYLDDGLTPLPDQAAIHMSFAPTDTVNWYTISGMYIPDSAYEYVVLGNFFSNSLVNPVLLNPNGDQECAYVYYDDVCVSYSAEQCGVGTGFGEHSEVSRMHVWPVPFAAHLNVLFDRTFTTTVDLELCNMHGAVHWSGRLIQGSRFLEIIIPDLASGIYQLRTKQPLVGISPIIVVHIAP